MIIIKPSEKFDILIIQDLVSEEDLRILQAHSLSELYYGRATELEKDKLGHTPKNNRQELNEAAHAILTKTEKIVQEVMHDVYSDIKFNKHWNYGGYSLRTSGHSMEPHTDAALELELKEISSILYINDDFKGGQIYYPDVDFYYQPVAGSLAMHRVEHLHGVTEVLSGWRITYGFFGSEEK